MMCNMSTRLSMDITRRALVAVRGVRVRGKASFASFNLISSSDEKSVEGYIDE